MSGAPLAATVTSDRVAFSEGERRSRDPDLGRRRRVDLRAHRMLAAHGLFAFAPTALLERLAAAVQGFFGFGYGIITMGVLTVQADLVHASGFVNLTALLLSIAMVVREHPRVLWPLVARVVPAMSVGIAVGLAALSGLPRDLLVGTLAVTIIAIAGWNVFGRPMPPRVSAPLDVGVGFVAGLFSGAFQTGGPPLVIHLYRRPEPPIALVVTLQMIFIASGVVRALLAGSQGLLLRSTAVEAAFAAPFVVAGTLVGLALSRRADPERFRRAAWLALGALGVALLASTVG